MMNSQFDFQEEGSGRLLSDETKWGIIIGWKYYEQSYDQLMETFNLKSKGTISKIIEKYELQHDVENNFKFSGKNGYDLENIQEIVENVISNELNMKYNLYEVKQQVEKIVSHTVSNTTLQQIMKDIGFRYGCARKAYQLNEQNKQQRKNFCKIYAYQTNSNIVYSDETIFSLVDNKIQVWYSSDFNQKIKTKNMQYKNSFAHIWAGVSRKGKTSIYVFDENVNAQNYQKCIKECYLPFLNEKGGELILLQDGAPSHIAKTTKQYFKENKINYLQNPPWSPEMNAVELVWSKMKCILNKLKVNNKINNKDELINLIKQIWNRDINDEFINNCIDHITDNMKQIFDNDGDN